MSRVERQPTSPGAALALVVWDVHGVLLSGRPADQDAFALVVGLHPDAWLEVRNGYCGGEHAWERVETGHLTLDAFALELSSRIEAAGGRCPVETAKGLWGAPTPFSRSLPDLRLLDFIASDRRVRHAIGTNNIAEWGEVWRPMLPTGRFDWVFDSSDVGQRKPESGFWSHVEERTGFRGKEILLVDDRETNIAAAVAHGWHGLQFSDAASCLTLIEALLSATRRSASPDGRH